MIIMIIIMMIMEIIILAPPGTTLTFLNDIRVVYARLTYGNGTILLQKLLRNITKQEYYVLKT